MKKVREGLENSLEGRIELIDSYARVRFLFKKKMNTNPPTITQEKEIKKQKSSTPIKIFNEKARVNTISDTIHLPDFFND